ncbi:MAG: hypothetical protein SFV15_25370, partial [Polyangiaceae bacterium]|nr:hypothetical protein [Polyangiaceae bacterium]
MRFHYTAVRSVSGLGLVALGVLLGGLSACSGSSTSGRDRANNPNNPGAGVASGTGGAGSVVGGPGSGGSGNPNGSGGNGVVNPPVNLPAEGALGPVALRRLT